MSEVAELHQDDVLAGAFGECAVGTPELGNPFGDGEVDEERSVEESKDQRGQPEDEEEEQGGEPEDELDTSRLSDPISPDTSRLSDPISVPVRPEEQDSSSRPGSLRANPFDASGELHLEENYYGFVSNNVSWLSEGVTKVLRNSGSAIQTYMSGSANPDDLKPSSEQMNAIHDLEESIDKLKKAAIAEESSESQKELAVSLTEKRVQLQQVLELVEMQLAAGVRLLLGHQFLIQGDVLAPRQHLCETCQQYLLPLQQHYRCELCSARCHIKCYEALLRPCPARRSPIQNICPEIGLAAQQWRCGECRAALSPAAALLCDHDGLRYCPSCCWRDDHLVPARVLLNWDFSSRQVCRSCHLYLNMTFSKPLLSISKYNPALYRYVDDLQQVESLRQALTTMRGYLIACPSAVQDGALRDLGARRYLLDSTDLYSLSDLVAAQSGKLLPDVSRLHANFAQHIKTDCDFCQRRGKHCPSCDQDGLLFPFDTHATVCKKCDTVVHRHCWYREGKVCPGCSAPAEE